MALDRTRRRFLQHSCLLVALGVAGCASDSPADPDANDTTGRTPSPTADLDSETAEERALSAETDHVESRLQNATCLESWGIGEYTMEATATVSEQTADGYRIEVQRPYSYSKTSQIADVATHAVYLVAENQTERLSGDSVDPC